MSAPPRMSAPDAAMEPESDVASDIDFDFVGSLAEDEVESPATMRLEDAPAPAAALHAGFIVQKEGKLERVTAWHGDSMVAGRSSECDILLAQDEVSRRHVRFERRGDVYEVLDLGSVNGTFVNGRRVDRHALHVGDVVQIENYQLTFVLDRDPIDAALAAAKPAARPASRDTMAMTMLQEAMPHRPGFTELIPTSGPADDTMISLVEPIAEAELLTAVEEVDDPAAKPEDATPLRGSSRASSVQDLGRASNPNLEPERQLRLELRVRLDLLPPALRRALEEAGETDLVLPAELHLKR